MSTKTLIIAEKPSVAADIVKILPGKFQREKTHYEGEHHVVSYAVGHLVSICYPEEIDAKYQKWDLNELPILPEDFPLKALPDSKAQLNILQKLIRRKDISDIVNACDAGREGELIFKYIMRFVWNKSVSQKTCKRLWLQSMTKESIREAFNHLKNNEEMQPLEDTALCRSESDWLIGINATRALTGFNSRRGGFFLTPCGRVQTPTLSMLVKRERIRQSFIPRPYTTLQATFTGKECHYQGKWFNPNFTADSQDAYLKADRIWNKDNAEAIIAACLHGTAKVNEESKESSQKSPQLYDLTSLQREANSRFGFSAKNTLGLVQTLYERHKLLTYPRTDSRYLPEDYLQASAEIMEKQSSWELGKFAAQVLQEKYITKDFRVFNNAKISDHHAIIPTNNLPKTLSEPEMKIYRMVVQRFLAVFFPAARFFVTRRVSIVNSEHFLTEGKILLEPGWKAIYGQAETEDKDTIPPLPDNDTILCTSIDKEQKETKPPARYTEATLLSAMENSGKLIEDEELAEAMKERGLGTPATRAAIIEKLLKDKYIVREGKDLTPTGKAFELLSILEAMKIDVLASPEMTGEWEYKLNQILKGEISRNTFMAEIRDLTKHITSQIVNFEQSEERPEAPFSPVNGQRYFTSPTAYHSEDGKITLRKILGGKCLQEAEVVALLQGKTIGPFADFRSKKGKPFTASVQIVNNKVEFLFANSTEELDVEAILSQEPLGLSPIDQTPVYETPAGYISKSALEGDTKNGLKISKIILAKEIMPQHISQLLTEGKTELIQGFISKKKRPFDAYLLLAKNGKISFEFPPRKSKEN